MAAPISPYHRPGFYETALNRGRHREIVGGRWDETGRAEMQILLDAGLQPGHHLIDIGAGCLRLGCKAVPYLDPGHYWATDKSRALMLRGRALELPDPARLSQDHLVEDDSFGFPGIPPIITHALAFALFTHLPLDHLGLALTRIRAAFPALHCLMFTVFVAPDLASHARALRQPDGVVTHADRAPYHHVLSKVLALCQAAGFPATARPDRLPRGQVLILSRPL